MKAGRYQTGQRNHGELPGQKFLFPKSAVLPDDMAAVAFVNGGIGLHNRFRGRICFRSTDDICLVPDGNLGIRHNGRRKNCMCFTTASTSDTADTEFQFTGRGFEKAFIITMDMKTAGMPAGTGELVKLQTSDKIIIKNLS